MTDQMTAKAAAEAIRPMLKSTPVPVSAEDRHHRRWLEQVCKALSLAPSYDNTVLVQHLLDEKGISGPAADEYPKMLTERDDRNRLVAKRWPDNHPTRADTDVVFASKEEEDFYNAHQQKGVDQHDMDMWAQAEAPAPDAGAAAAPPPAPQA